VTGFQQRACGLVVKTTDCNVPAVVQILQRSFWEWNKVDLLSIQLREKD
jgi:hypothetical protein